MQPSNFIAGKVPTKTACLRSEHSTSLRQSRWRKVVKSLGPAKLCLARAANC